MAMKCCCLGLPGQIEMKDVQEPIVEASEVLIKVEAAGICGSDIGAFRGVNPLVTYPRIIGHEIAGTVLAIGANVKRIGVGDRVIVDPYIYCGKCYPCGIGRTNCCENLKVIGVHVDGGMAELFTHPSELVNKVPENIPLEHIPMAEPLTIALHAIHRTNVKAGEHIAIIGAGPIGMLTALAAMAYGAVPILGDIVTARLELAKSLGIKNIVDSTGEDAEARIRGITGGRMAEVVIEASGANQAIRNSIDFVSYAGRIALTGWPKAETCLPTNLFTKKELDIKGSRTSAGEFEEALALMANGTIDVAPIVSKVVRMDEIPEAVCELSEHPERYLKINAVF